MHITVSISNYFAGDLIGFSTELLIAVLLLVLTLRAAKLPGRPLANIGFAACGVLWSAGGLANAVLLVMGLPHDGRPVSFAQAAQFSGAAAFPIPILAIWRPFAVREWQKSAMRVLHIGSCVAAGAIASLLGAAGILGNGRLPLNGIEHSTSLNAALFFALGGAVALRRKSTPRAIYLPSLAIVYAVCGAAVATSIARHSPSHGQLVPGLAGLAAHLVLLFVLCSFLLFARFRFADLFIHYGVRILLAGLWAAVLVSSIHAALLWDMARAVRSPAALHIFFILLLTNLFLLSFTFVDAYISKLVIRWLFHPPNYREEGRKLAKTLRQLSVKSEIAAAVENAARGPLALSGARLVPLDEQLSLPWPVGLAEGELVELELADPLRETLPLPLVEVIVPVASTGRVTHALLVSPGFDRPGLVTKDLEYLRTIAAHCGGRLDALHREREAIERQGRESLLVQQVTEAELRALRAQVNPHFLFNSLNTIADLIVLDPPRAEAMTLRLASVFRHVLAHASRSLTTIRDEVEFLRTYLYIEEVRFRDRLQVEIEVAPEVAGESVPSLILQPLVENALKHGLGPKPGPGRLWIMVTADGDQVRLVVADDGYGPGRRAESEGVGLTNVAERLRTLYQDKGSVTLEAREGGGSVATVRIPRAKAVSAA